MKFESKWRRFEKLVARVQQELAPNALVTHNDKIRGHNSGELRQVDISVKQKVGQYDILIAIDCKDYKVPVNVKRVEEFSGLIEDIQANKGAMVAANGFTETAKRIGEKAGLDLYRLVDAEAHDWQAYISIPVLCDFRRIQKYRFIIPNSVASFLPSMDPNEIVVYGLDYAQQVTIKDLIQIQWNSGKLPSEPGEHRSIPLTKVITSFTKDEVFEADIFADIVVERRYFFGQLPLIQGRGFVNEYTGGLLTPGFTTDWLDAAEVERSWRQLDSIDELAVNPVLRLVALDLFDISEKPR
jgi:hypothetical protein